MRIWITGSRGYIGSRLIKSFRRRFPRATVFGDPPDGGAVRRLKSVEDVRIALARARPTHVVHCAGLARPASRRRLMAAHVAPTFYLLEAVRRLPAPRPRVLLLGSAAEYGAGRSGRRFSEKTPCRPQTEYGISKHLQTKLGLSYHACGVPVLVARLFNLFAPDAPPTFAVSRVWGLLRRKKTHRAFSVKTGPRDAVRDYLTPGDAFDALGALLARGRPGDIYNVCSGRGLRMGDLFDAMAEGAGVSVTWKSGGAGSGKSAASFAVGDPAKIRRHTGWRPRVDVLAVARAGGKT